MSAPRQLSQYYEKYWREGLEIYSGDRQGYAGDFRRWMRAELTGMEGRNILEVGCGDASFTGDLAGYFPAVTALDISARQIEHNARRLPQIRFLQHDVSEALPFGSGNFDVIWCSEVLGHLFDPAFAIREMHRVLASGGRLLITVPYHGRLKNLLIALFKWDEHFAPTGPHIRFFTKASLETLVRRAGFGRTRLWTWGLGRAWRDIFAATNILLRAQK